MKRHPRSPRRRRNGKARGPSHHWPDPLPPAQRGCDGGSPIGGQWRAGQPHQAAIRLRRGKPLWARGDAAASQLPKKSREQTRMSLVRTMSIGFWRKFRPLATRKNWGGIFIHELTIRRIVAAILAAIAILKTNRAGDGLFREGWFNLSAGVIRS